jgi:LemA protein
MRMTRAVVLAAMVSTLAGCGYNRIQELDERVEQRRSDIGVQLTARNQLIPNMVATVEGAADFERGTFIEVAEARAGLARAREQVEQAVGAGDVNRLETADAQLTRSIGTYINVAVEAYPQLRATESFQALQDQLAESENRIAVARQDYNEAVRQHNAYIRQFPQTLTARLVGAERKEPYQPPAGVEEPPVVDFRRDGG